jgi:hypothetical protein
LQLVGQEVGCERIVYGGVPEAKSALPTVEATGEDLCLSRLPTYRVVVSWSGVQYACSLE